jgi:precorrin-6A/cobalt-precorrin-6A reductase
MRILILGGTEEASTLAGLIANRTDFEAILSLAGRTSAPRVQPVPTRSGGFGGAAGLRTWLRQQTVDAVIDATHPFAAEISANAVIGCAEAGVPLGSIVREPWQARPGDCWLSAPDVQAAATALGEAPQRVFLTLGRLELAVFSSAPQHEYFARLIERPDGIELPPRIRFLFARGPFDPDAERRFMQAEDITVLVSKNSGGPATYAKIEAARALGLPVIMIARPVKPVGVRLDGPEAALAWLDRLICHSRPVTTSERGV